MLANAGLRMGDPSSPRQAAVPTSQPMPPEETIRKLLDWRDVEHLKHSRGKLLRWGSVEQKDSRMRWERHAEGSWPGRPRIVQQREVPPVVSDSSAPSTHCCQELSIVGSTGEAEIAGGKHVVATPRRRGTR